MAIVTTVMMLISRRATTALRRQFQKQRYDDIIKIIVDQDATMLLIRLGMPGYMNAFRILACTDTIDKMLRLLRRSFKSGCAHEFRAVETGQALGNISTLNDKCYAASIQFTELLTQRHQTPYFITGLIRANPKISCKRFVKYLGQMSRDNREELIGTIRTYDPVTARLIVML